ncbi:hypothetical protein NDA16_002143 [Ustilago loliicola]|nr:hypothetical protein NDA16_002143 [Ustilago loliicola]
MMAPLAKRPRRSEDYDAAPGGGTPYYDNIPGTSLTRASVGPNTSTYMQAPWNPAYLTAAASNGAASSSSAAAANGSLAGATSPLLASHLSSRSLAQVSAGHSHHPSSGPEDNEEMTAPAKSSSTSAGTRGRGSGRGRASGTTRGRGRGRGANAAATSRLSAAAAAASAADISHSYSEEGLINGHPLNGMEEDPDEAAPNPLIFQCRSCYRLLGDSVSFVATDTDLGYVILSDVSDVVQQDTAYETSTEPGKDIGSTFARLRCGGCQASVGRNYRTTPRDLDDLRDCFSLEVDAIMTYMLGSGYTKQLPGDEEDDEGKETRERQAVPLSAGQGLESKMERTRALTIEMSDRLIKAEEDIRRYSALVEQLMQEKANAQASTSAPQPVEEQAAAEQAAAADESHSTPPLLPIADPAAAGEKEMQQEPAAQTAAEAGQEPSTPPAEKVKPESQRNPTTSRPTRKSTTTNLASTRSKRSLGGGSNGVVVLLDNSNVAS